MPIQSGDVRLVKSKVMLDTPEGGGGPTGIVIADGVSNDVYPDVSALDRVNGRVNARQIHLHVNTPTRDMYLGANLIVSRPPEDENISITLADTGETFDTRTEAITRLEAYLFVGASWSGVLFGSHLAGMQVISVLQRTATLPSIGDALVLTKREGYSDQFRQYIRVIAAGAVETTFEDPEGVYTRFVVSLQLSDPLREDFSGFDASRYDPTTENVRLRTRLSKTVVANASRYYGVVPLKVEAGIGDRTARLESIFTQLVPSAQVETPILDATTNQVSFTVTQAGDFFTDTRRISAPFVAGGAGERIFVGGAIMPGSLTVSVQFWPTLTDDGAGGLLNGATKVATVDYANGVLTALDHIYNNTDLPVNLTYKPAVAMPTVGQAQGFPITQANRSLNYVRSILPVPAVGTLSVSYRAQGVWYTLTDNGRSELRGTDAAFGAGILNRTSGTVAFTLGALPDVDSAILFAWTQPDSEIDNDMLQLDNNGKLYIAGNVDGQQGVVPAENGITPGALNLTWNDGSARTVTDDGYGNLTGYGTGIVNYAEGWFKLSPTTLPPKGTQLNILSGQRPRVSKMVPTASTGSGFTIDIGEPVAPGTLSMYLNVQRKSQFQLGPLQDFGTPNTHRLTDDGHGVVGLSLALIGGLSGHINRLPVGTIDYTTGLITLSGATVLTTAQAKVITAFDNIYVARETPLFTASPSP